jgi:hypothetical protein
MLYRFGILLLAISCASNNPTPYQKQKKKELGYSDSQTDNLRIATFRGNSYTSKEKARRYAEFRAIEICRESTEKHANIMDVFDKTVEKEITRSSGSTWGPSYFGMYPYYSRYSSFGIGAGFNTISTNSWNETLTFPIIDVYFTCAKEVYRPLLFFKELPAGDIKHLVKDVKGAIQVEKIPEKSPNGNVLETGDIILRGNGIRIEKVYQFINLFAPGNQNVKVDLLREGDLRKVTVKSEEITDKVKKMEKEIIQKVCKYKNKKEQAALKRNKLCQ